MNKTRLHKAIYKNENFNNKDKHRKHLKDPKKERRTRRRKSTTNLDGCFKFWKIRLLKEDITHA